MLESSQKPNANRRQTQNERTQSTRAKLCKAALEVLAEVGYHSCTTPLISIRAGVSRGALTHHFPTKLDVVTASFEYLLQDWEAKRRTFVEHHNGELDVKQYADFLWDEVFRDPNYVAALEMLLAARGDAQLQRQLALLLEELSVTRLQIWQSVFSDMLSKTKGATLMRMTICMFRGLSMQRLLEADGDDHSQEMIETWKEFLVRQTEELEQCDGKSQIGNVNAI